MTKRVRVNSTYIYEPCGWDTAFPPYGVQIHKLQPGDRVQVVNLPGCPKANTMHHAHISKDGEFMGLVHVNSLLSYRKNK